MNRLRAKDVMSHPVITVRPDIPIPEIAKILTEHRISGVPVVDDQGRLVGIVTEADLLLKEAGPGGLPKLAFFLPARSKEVQEQLRRYEGKVAADMMTQEVITATEETPLRELAALMARNQINRIPILRDDQVVGIVSRNDVLKAFTRSDETLHQEARQTLVHDLRIDPEPLDIQVKDGVVTILGQVERKSEVGLMEMSVRAIDGVVSVDVSGLTYDVDDQA